MAGWNNQKAFQDRVGGNYSSVPCMTKLFGIDGCPYCAQASKFFDAKEDEKGRRIYFKKQYWGWAHIMDCPTAEHKNQYRLVQLPVKVVTTIMEKVSHADPDLQWPVPSDLNEGFPLGLSKRKSDNQIAYSVDGYIQHPSPIDADHWAKVGPTFVDVTDTLKCVQAVNTLDPKWLFLPSKHMKEGEVAKIRLLPAFGHEGDVPFGFIQVHNVQTQSDWDRAWAAVQWDPTREEEVRASLGMLSGDDDEPPFDPSDTPGGLPGNIAR